MNDSEEALRLALLIERLAHVARDAGAKPEAALDVARRVVIDHAGEMITGGIVRLGSGASVFDAIEATRADMPQYWTTKAPPTPTTPPAVPAPTTTAARRKLASDRLSVVNGDSIPHLNAGTRTTVRDAE